MGNLPEQADWPEYLVHTLDDERLCGRRVCLYVLGFYLTRKDSEFLLACVSAGAVAHVGNLTFRRNPRYAPRKH